MLKFASILAFILISLVALIVSATVQSAPRLSSSGGSIVSLQRCNTTDCLTSSCETIIEFQAGKCHPPVRRGLFDQGEILSCLSIPTKKLCFTESVFDNHLHTSPPSCAASSLFESAPRELDTCTQDIFGDPLKFFKYSQNGNGVTMYRGCDYGCNNCEILIPLAWNECKDIPEHAFFRDWTFQVATPSECTAPIRRDTFRFDGCDGEPISVENVFTDRCYRFGGHTHRFLCR